MQRIRISHKWGHGEWHPLQSYRALKTWIPTGYDDNAYIDFERINRRNLAQQRDKIQAAIYALRYLLTKENARKETWIWSVIHMLFIIAAILVATA